MEIFRLDKAIENEKLDLEMAMAQLKEAKEHLSQSLKRRKELAKKMNDHQYIEEKIEDLLHQAVQMKLMRQLRNS